MGVCCLFIANFEVKNITMKSILFLIGLVFSQTLWAQSIHKTYLPSKFPDRIILGWNADAVANSQAVNWRTDNSVEKAVAEIAIATGEPDFAKSAIRINALTEKFKGETEVVHFHSANFQNLQPNTQYAYRVGDGEYWSEWFHFTTAQNAAAPFSFLYFGDAQNDLRSIWSRTIRAAYSQLPSINFMIHAGDLINNANYDYQWGEWFEAGGWLNGMVPSLATPGNHEYFRDSETKKTTLSSYWKPSFVHPANGPESVRESAYFLVYQGVLFVALDSQRALVDADVMQEQAEWLTEVLEKNTQRWVVIFHHHPVYSTKAGRDNVAWRDTMEPIYKKYGVDLVLQGHDHTYGRGINMPLGNVRKNPTEPIYVVSVSGPKMYDIGLQDWMDRAASNVQLFQIISVENNKLSYKSYEATGELYDAFDLVKNKKGKKKMLDYNDSLPVEKLDLPPAVKERFTPEKLGEYESRFERYKKRKSGS